MSRTISARLTEAEIEAVDALAKQQGVSRSQLLASIAKQAVDAEARHPADNVNTEARQDEHAKARQAVNEAEQGQKLNSMLEDEAIHNVFVELPRPFTCPECGETSHCATLCPICGKLELHGCSENCATNIQGWFLADMYHEGWRPTTP